MNASFTRAAAALAFTLAQAFAPVWCSLASDAPASVTDDARATGHAIAHGATSVGHTVADKSRETGHAVADGTRSARDTIRDDSKKTGHAIADGARAIGRTVREGMQKLKAGVTGKSSEPAPKG